MNNRWAMLTVVVATQWSNSLLSQGVPTVFAFLQAEFELSRAEVGLFISAMEVGTVLTFILGGWAADALGIRRILPAGQALMGLVGLGFAAAASYTQALAVLLFAGVALGMSSPALTLAVLYWFPARERATAMGLRQTGVSLAGVMCALLLPTFALSFGWRTGLLVIGSSAIAVAILVAVVYRDPPEVAALGAAAPPTWDQFRALALQRELLFVTGFAIALFASQFSLLGYLILYLRDQLSFPVVAGGLILAVGQGGALCGRVAWGVFSDVALGGRRVPALALAGSVASALLLALALLPDGTSSLVIVPLVFCLGFTALGWHGLRHALLVEIVPRRVAGTALGVSQTMSEFGPVLGPPVFGALADLAGFRVAWLALAAITAVATLTVYCGIDERRAAAIQSEIAAAAKLAARIAG